MLMIIAEIPLWTMIVLAVVSLVMFEMMISWNKIFACIVMFVVTIKLFVFVEMMDS
jgi:hypothetical protein